MPKMDFGGILGPLFGQVVLDASGNGTIRFAPSGESWSIENVSVSVSTATREATATLFKGQVSAATRLSGTFTGSSGDSNTLEQPIVLTDGQGLFVQWLGGDVGATATATIMGKKTVVGRGFRALT